MKNIIKISALACAVALLLGIAGCKKENLDTAQFSKDAVTLASYGPNPVMRGGQLRFFGSNLQNIVEVNVPGVGSITKIQVVESGKVSEIRVTLPVEGPEVGLVSIRTKSGQVLTTKSELTYTEPIVFEDFSAPNPAYPGDVVTLNGDYMNLVSHVIFEGGAISYVEEGATRHEAKAVIPAEAVSGKIILSDGGEVENLIYSEKDLKIGKPSVTKLDKKNVKPGDEITFTGKHLEMIKTIEFTRLNEVVELDAFVKDGSITVYVPEIATNGIVQAVSFAGDKFEICDIECIMPSELEATNTPKAGKELVIKGKDLDVVAKVDLAGAENASFQLKDDGKLYVTVPATATDGTAKLFHSNGEFVNVDYTIVHPTITKVSPLELYAGDEPVIVEGTDLDLVASAVIGTKDAEISAKSETSITLATAVTSVSGKVILTLANGETIESTEEVKMNYHSKVIVTSRPDGQHIGQEVVLKGQNMDLVESIFIGDTKVTKYGLRTPEEIHFLMPWCKVGYYELKFQLYDGDTEVQSELIEVQLEIATKTLWEGEWSCGDWGGNQELAYGKYDWSTANPGDVLTFELELSGPQTWHQLDLRHGDGWGNLPTSGFQELTEGQTCATYTLDAATIADLAANGGLIITGTSYILKKVTISSEIPQEITVYQGPCNLTWDDTGRFGIAMTYFERCVPGSKLIFYINQNGKWGQIQINDGAWGNGDMKFAELGNDAYIKPDFIAADVTRVELTLTEALLTHIIATPGDYFGINTDTKDGRCGMVIQGSDWTIEQVTILP